ncbi:hypothetical protein F5Y18DRAFT_124117 [Xylariaceae sp. FL1019]|nr:hypothetical protein F5Y18DRAFT_124117 [Xylariaceae sp. FL1019]
MPPEQYTVSVIIWGGDKPGEDPAGHVAIAVHHSTSQPTACHMHHARCPDQIRFIYESRPHQFFDADPAPRGRCNLRTDLSPAEAMKANDVLSHFGTDITHLPFFGDGNCHNWNAAAVTALEEAGLILKGDGDRWNAMIGMGPLAIKTKWVEAEGREWVSCRKFDSNRPATVDAKWGDEPESKTNGGMVDIKDRVRNLQQLLHSRKDHTAQ